MTQRLGNNRIENGSVTGNKIADGAVNSNNIVDGAITTNKLVDQSVDASKIKLGAINTQHFVPGSVKGNVIGLSAISSNNIVDGSITAEKIAPGAGGNPAAFDTANAAFDAANVAIVNANNAYTHANAAFDAANNSTSTSSQISNNNTSIAITGVESGVITTKVNDFTVTTITANLISHSDSVLESALFRVSVKNISSNITISNTYNHMSIGPISIDDNIEVTLEPNAEWVII